MNNSISLKIGMLEASPAWKFILDQIGLSWSLIDETQSITISAFSLIIVNRPISFNERTILLSYVESGGAIVFTPEEFEQVKTHCTKQIYVSSLPPQNRTEYRYHDIFDLHERVFVFADNAFVKTEKNGDGIISYLGLPINSIITRKGVTRKGFFANADRLPREHVALVSKNVFRQIILSHFEYLHHQRNLPFVHKWYYPTDAKTIFTFRVDSDKGTKEEIEEIYQLSEKHKIPTTWFLDVKSHETWLNYFTKFTAQEIGVHCYHHIIYKSEILNEENFERACSLLKKHGMISKGIAAPTGGWNRYIDSAIRKMNFNYSSEFGYDYDNLPSFPYANSSFSPVIQLPIHPTCVGTMLRARMGTEAMIGYFKNIVNRNIVLHEPICLYQHPTHRHNEVFDEIFRYINSKNILKMSFSSYAEWWKRRENFIFTINLNDSVLSCESSTVNDAWVRISLKGNKEIITAPKKEIDLRTFHLNEFLPTVDIPKDIMRARKFNAHHFIQNAVDWWIKITE